MVTVEPESHAEAAADREWLARSERAAPNVDMAKRLMSVVRFRVSEIAGGLAGRIPFRRSRNDVARLQPLYSDSRSLFRWWKAPYGVRGKPSSLGEIPADYVIKNKDRIPFLGLREYWYPAVPSGEVVHNKPTPVSMLGDNIVLFRERSGRVRALQDRCPHRGPLLSIGQVGVWEPGTITCRYHGMTFDGDGECVAFLADGPRSHACGKVRVRSYPVEEIGSMVFIYMGTKEPRPVRDSVPFAERVFAQKRMVLHPMDVGYSHLNILDNAVDLTHVGCLHRTCVAFGDQKLGGQLDYEEVDGGVRACFKQDHGHSGSLSIDQIHWFLPNLVYHGPGELGAGAGAGYFWFVPTEVGRFTAWLIIGVDESGSELKQAFTQRMLQFVFRRGEIPGTSCFFGGDAPMQASQGRVVRWEDERLTRTDRAVVKVRRMLIDAHKAELAEFAERERVAQSETVSAVAEPAARA